MKKIFWGVTMLLALCSCGNKKEAQPAQDTLQEYPTMVLAKQKAELQSVYPATIKGQEDIEIRPRIDGFIDGIYVDEGSAVRKGQSLFKINSPQAEQNLISARASVNSAQAAVNTAQLNVDRMRPLAEKEIISDVQLQTYENAYKSALASLTQAQATLTQAQATIGWTNVTSPVDGIVGSIPLRQGSLVNSTNVLTTVSGINYVYAYFSVSEKELLDFLRYTQGTGQVEKIKQLPAVTLILSNGMEYPEKGKVETISGMVDVATGSVGFRVKFLNDKGLLRAGTSGKVIIPETFDSVFVIPQAATFALQDKIMVYKIQGDSAVQKSISAIPTPDGKNYAVTDGLDVGDRIVSDGIAKLKNGTKIKTK